MELAGYDLSREPSRDELEFDGNFATHKGAVGSASRILQNLERFRVAMNSKMIPIDFSTEGLAASGAISANRRAINSGYPLVSRFGAAPAWLALESQETRFQIVKIVWDEMGWLTGPKTFAEAASMRDDDGMHALTDSVDVWLHRVSTGDLEDLSYVRNDIRQAVLAYKDKPWATKVGRMTTYVFVPVAVAEILLGGSGLVGGFTALLGATAQSISDLIDRSKKRSWLSIGSDFLP